MNHATIVFWFQSPVTRLAPVKVCADLLLFSVKKLDDILALAQTGYV